MDEANKKAFDFAADVTKQLITLASGIIAFTVTFNKDLLKGLNVGASYESIVLIAFSWSFFLFSIISGIVVLLALTGELQPPAAKSIVQNQLSPQESEQNNPSVGNPIAKWASISQLLTFAIGTVFILIFGLYSILHQDPQLQVVPAIPVT
ncbi:MAG TPA: hypothetical protein PKA82_15725 [Pyrinomonadaceae bacterium]|nr:hypothetical protein [Pyrinomonadaceae bacterium]